MIQKLLLASGLCLLVWAKPTPSLAEEPKARANAVAIRDLAGELGPFRIGDRRFTAVLHQKRITGAAVADPEWQTTLAGIEIKDEKGSVHFRESFSCVIAGEQFAETLGASVDLLQGKERSGLLVGYGRSPSTPLGGQSWQVFGLFDGKLVPFAKPIFAEGDLIEEAHGNVVRTAPEPGLEGEVLHFRVWTGNFFVVYPVRVEFLMAKAMPAWRCSERTAQHMKSRCRYRIETERRPGDEEMTFIRMFAGADESAGTPEHVVVKKSSTVEFLSAKGEVRWEEDERRVTLSPGDDFWLEIRVDGKEGWIHTQEDFQAVGLPQAG